MTTPDRLDRMPEPEYANMVGRVLAEIRSSDAGFPKPDPAMVIAWARAFSVHDLAYRDLSAGVVALFADDRRTRDRVLPGDVIAKAREIRRDRAERESPAEIAARDEVRDRRVLGRIADRQRELSAADEPVKYTRPSQREAPTFQGGNPL